MSFICDLTTHMRNAHIADDGRRVPPTIRLVMLPSVSDILRSGLGCIGVWLLAQSEVADPCKETSCVTAIGAIRAEAGTMMLVYKLTAGLVTICNVGLTRTVEWIAPKVPCHNGRLQSAGYIHAVRGAGVPNCPRDSRPDGLDKAAKAGLSHPPLDMRYIKRGAETSDKVSEKWQLVRPGPMCRASSSAWNGSLGSSASCGFASRSIMHGAQCVKHRLILKRLGHQPHAARAQRAELLKHLRRQHADRRVCWDVRARSCLDPSR